VLEKATFPPANMTRLAVSNVYRRSGWMVAGLISSRGAMAFKSYCHHVFWPHFGDSERDGTHDGKIVMRIGHALALESPVRPHPENS
jgi:hypothetical protein